MNREEMKERRREKPTLVVSALIKKGGRYLLVKEPKFDFWRPPGGRMEWGDTIEETLQREIKEELGTEIEIVRPLGFGEDRALLRTHNYVTSRVVLYFLCRLKRQIKRYYDEGETSKPKWVTKEEMKSMKGLEPALKSMLKRFGI